MTVAHSTLTGSDLHDPKAHATSHEPGGSDALAVDAAAGTGSLRTLGTTASKAAAGNHTVPAFVGSGGGHAAGHVPDPGASAGSMAYLCEDGTWAVPSGSGGGLTGTDDARFVTGYNGGGSTITKGSPLYVLGGTGVAVLPALQAADNYADEPLLGLAAADIAAAAAGLVQIEGTLSGLDTHAWPAGSRLYIDAAGAFTDSTPAVGPKRVVGFVVVAHATTGSIHILPQRISPNVHTHLDDKDGGEMGSLTLKEVNSVGAAAAGHQTLWINSADHKLYRTNSSGVDTLIG